MKTVLAAAVAIATLSACGTGSKAAAPALPPISSSVPATTPQAVTSSSTSGPPSTAPAPAPTTAAPTSAAPTSAAPTSTGPTSAAPPSIAGSTGAPAVGQIVTGAGSALTRPAASTTRPLTHDCGSLVDGGYIQGTCESEAYQGDNIYAFIEQSKTSPDVRYLVYRSTHGSPYSLVLRDDTHDTGSSANPGLTAVDLADDKDLKVLLLIPAANAMYLNSLDVIDVSGSVVIHLDLAGGFARGIPGGGLGAWFPSASGGYVHDTIKFLDGQWRVTAQDHESDSQAAPNDAGGFTP